MRRGRCQESRSDWQLGWARIPQLPRPRAERDGKTSLAGGASYAQERVRGHDRFGIHDLLGPIGLGGRSERLLPTGGIVSGNQEDLQVGLVAFDADTSSEYGVSYRNESLLGTPNRPQPVTSGATAMPASTPPPEHSAADLAAWYEHVKETVWQVPGIAWSNLSESNNRIEIGLRPLRGVRERFEAILGTLDVPRKAIVIEVGCERVGQWPQEISEASEDSFFRAIDYSLEVVSQASYGETVRIKLTLRNITGEPAKVALGGKPAYDFVVTTTDGEGVWKWKCGGITWTYSIVKPGAGEGLEFIGEWEQVDNRGRARFSRHLLGARPSGRGAA